jgi:cob(I)alamin adenosyltransferase
MAKSYTGTGDDGTTGRFGAQRVSKTSPLIAALGALDEANAAIGIARSAARQPAAVQLNTLNSADRYTLTDWLTATQHLLFRVGADAATPQDQTPAAPRISDADLAALEASIDGLDAILPQLNDFVLPGGDPAAAALHAARSIMRRAERELVAARDAGEQFGPTVIPYVNRFSSYLFALARWVNWRAGIAETHPNYGSKTEAEGKSE